MSALRWGLAAVRAAGWAPLAVFLAHVLSSRVLEWYRAFPPLDVPMHLAGGAAIAYFFWRSVQLPESRPAVGELVPAAAGLLSFFAVGPATVVWELAEWTSDRGFGTHAQLGLEDTLLDMALGLAGGAVFVLAALLRPAVRPSSGAADGGAEARDR